MADPIDYSRTHRILLLIDLNPILISNPKPYLQAVRAAAEAILNFPSLSASLFSLKFFYSSLPLLSYPAKPPILLRLRFEESTETLGLLTEALDSVSGLEKRGDEVVVGRCSKASFVDMALREVLHGYKWEAEEGESGMDFGLVRSNLVIVLSPVCDSIEFVAEFMDVDKDDEMVSSVDKFIGRFRDVFEHVGNAFGRNDMHLAWIDVKTEAQCTHCDVAGGGCNEFFKEGLKSMGWGFCSTDSVILGSALVPMGLIYPMIGFSSNVRNYDTSSKKCRAQLNLEISDKNGKPLECRCCDLELIETNLLSRNKQKLGYQGQGLICWNAEGNEVSEKSLFDHTCKGTMSLRIQAVMSYSECQIMKSRLSKIVLVTESARKSGKHDVKVSGEFFADKVLKRLRLETDHYSETNTPMWTILLSYLYKENNWGLVSLTDGDGHLYTGILKPFSFDSALLFIVDSVSWPETEAGGLNVTTSLKDADEKSLSMDEEPGTQNCTVPLSQDGDKVRKKHRWLKSLNWSAFCKMAYGSSRADIADAYFNGSIGKSKKLKFLQCWIKQIKKCSSTHYIASHPEQHLTPIEFSDRLLQSSEAELPVSSPASVGENYVADIDRAQDAEVSGLISETSECFLSNLKKRIQDGLDNESLDLGAFSERIVNSTIQSLRVKLANEDASLNEDAPHTDSLTTKLVEELTALLLMDPKDMKAKHTNSEKTTSVDPCSSNDESEVIRRRYELQILFRMEIIRSELATCISESMKHKFVKQICMLLERIQCHLDGGFLGDWSLDSYLAKFLKTRYSHDLQDILHQIYSKMDLLLFSEEDENLNFLLNSEDSSQSFKERPEDDTFGETMLLPGQALAEKKSHKQLKSKKLTLKRNNSTSHVLDLAKAQEQRERARRFSSFTSWIPDLQRVWAPKHNPQVKRSQSDLSRKQYKRPSGGQSASLDMVFETPESNKRSCSRRSLDTPCSASKALFQDSQ